QTINSFDLRCWFHPNVLSMSGPYKDAILWAYLFHLFYFSLFFEVLMALPNCPKCQSEYTYADGDLLICPECAHEWKEGEVTEEQVIIKDANGNVLADGDRSEEHTSELQSRE